MEKFVKAVYRDEIFTREQFENLMAKIEEGRRSGDMYLIRDYLLGVRVISGNLDVLNTMERR